MTDRLMSGYLSFVLALEPKSLLDVGCGDADLLAACREHAVPAVGLELDVTKVRAARARNLDVRPVSAERLGCPDHCFDVVASRHVLHHLHYPARAVAEAVRAASRLVVLSEADFPSHLPGQGLAREIDEWSKAVHRSRGLTHFPPLGLRGLTALLDAHGLTVMKAAIFHDLTPINGPDLIARTLSNCPDDALRRHGEALAERARLEPVTRPSSCVVVAETC